ncbi:phosphate signaling complex protein PhoU [Salisediminibacterium beveridgei]|uniref:Phosphate-specific transport system accessory protein PhoU n=1 Tax=Salisediminibacterium beveridgei TaxID=632773 RepID=A0A1D7QTN9_9BACI|nr:phosphate signaling complex protein PhoU [Salisediminibacterium beveridgei]AOM82381.1 Phosphate transport system regulatory protein PhoU [Salisediminibacterium beveridgei]
MPTRTHFEAELSLLKDDIADLGHSVLRGFQDTIQAIEANNLPRLEDIVEEDETINRIELDINDKATMMIARQQPVASDLRKIIAGLKVASDLERIGDLTVDMAKAALRVDNLCNYETEIEGLNDLAKQVIQMIHRVFLAYSQSDVIGAQHIAALDDKIDKDYSDFVKHRFSSEKASEDVMQFVFMARYMERIADYGTNVAEWIIYEVNGQRFDLN